MDIRCLPGMSWGSNSYLLMGERPTLVDTSLDSAIVGQVADHMDIKDLEVIILTHRHVDHVGGAAHLLERSDAELYCSEKALEALMNADNTTGARTFGGHLEPLPVKELKSAVLEAGGTEWRVISTPGHTSDSICLYSHEEKALISGDTIFSDGGVGRWDLPSGSFKELKASVQKLAEMEVNSLYPGHNRWVEGNGQAHVAMALEALGMYFG